MLAAQRKIRDDQGPKYNYDAEMKVTARKWMPSTPHGPVTRFVSLEPAFPDFLLPWKYWRDLRGGAISLPAGSSSIIGVRNAETRAWNYSFSFHLILAGDGRWLHPLGLPRPGPARPCLAPAGYLPPLSTEAKARAAIHFPVAAKR